MGYVTPEQIAQAKEWDLLTYLQQYDPHQLVHVGGSTYCTREHDSLKMSEKALCEVNMTYATMRSYFRAAERARQHLSGFIVFSPASFDKEYSVESRTYAVSSDNKAFRPNMGGYSIYASSLDGSDPCVRLEQYMASEYGGKNGWQIERCYMMSDEVERAQALMRTEKEHER